MIGGGGADVEFKCSCGLFKPLLSLYYCEECLLLGCDDCAIIEIKTFYCPNCLFEVPTASVKAEKNLCARNCFECPVCEGTLTVVSKSSDPNSTLSSLDNRGSRINKSSSSTPESSPPGSPGGALLSGKDSCHYLSCGVCRWDSLEIGVKFDRPTGIALQMQKAESESPSVAEFEQLREHYEKLGRLYSSTAVAAGSTSNIIAGGLGKNRLLPSSLGSNSKFAFQKKEAMALTTYQCISNDVSSLGFHEKTSYLESSEVHQKTTLAQRFRQPDLQPITSSQLKCQRIRLRAKKAKRCKHCEHQLIKPDQKTQNTRFTIKEMARDRLPSIQIIKTPTTPVTEGPIDTHIIRVDLCLENPLYEPIDVTLTTPHDEVRIPHPSFRVDKFDELWEFERSSVVDVVSPNLQVEAMVQMKGNCSIVPLEIILANFGGASSYNLCVEFERTRKMEGREEAKTKQLLFLRIKI